MIKKFTLASLSLLVASNIAFAAPKDLHTGKVVTVKDTPAYTYLEVQDKDKNYWAAVMKANIKVGQTITLSEQVWMTNFNSKALTRTFDKILFADIKGEKPKNIHGVHGQYKKRPNPKFNEGLVLSKDKAIEVSSIGELFKNKDKYKNKNVSFTADVIQASNKVMGNTWVKLSDGKDSVIFRSSNEDEAIKVGDKVTVTGTINTDVNYGFSFKYEVIGVGATFKKQ